jgi:hypothetical protein
MRLPPVSLTIRWLMTRIAVLAAALGFLVDADREGRANGCGTPLLNAVAVLLALASCYALFRLVRFGIRYPS